MKTFEALQAFAEGYLLACLTAETTLVGVEDWVLWGGYDINFTGADLLDGLGEYDLHVSVYPAGWLENLPNTSYSFVVRGNNAVEKQA